MAEDSKKGSYPNEYLNSMFIRFCGSSDPDRAFLKVMFNLDQMVEEASKYVADNGYVYLYFFADKESYNNRNKNKAGIKKPFVAVNQKAKNDANNKVRRKLYAIQKEKDERGF